MAAIVRGRRAFFFPFPAVKAAKKDLEIKVGTTFGPIKFRARDKDGAPVDLDGWAAFAEVRRKPGAALEFDLSPSITDSANGEITIGMSDEATEALRAKAGRFQWDLVLETATGERRGPYFTGECNVTLIITEG